MQNTWWITIDSLPSNLHSANFALVCAVGNRRCVVQIFNPSLPNPGKHGTLKTLANIPTFPCFIKYSALVRSENVETLYFRKIIKRNSSRSKLGTTVPVCTCHERPNKSIISVPNIWLLPFSKHRDGISWISVNSYFISGWWCNVPILKNDGVKVNGKDDIPYIMENKTCLKPPTSLRFKHLNFGRPQRTPLAPWAFQHRVMARGSRPWVLEWSRPCEWGPIWMCPPVILTYPS